MEGKTIYLYSSVLHYFLTFLLNDAYTAKQKDKKEICFSNFHADMRMST